MKCKREKTILRERGGRDHNLGRKEAQTEQAQRRCEQHDRAQDPRVEPIERR